MVSENVNEFVLGALLRDIGKFKQLARFPEDHGKDHSTIGYEWLISGYGPSLIAPAARYRLEHDKEALEGNLSLLIYEANNLVTSRLETPDPEVDPNHSWQEDQSLMSIFSRIALQQDNGTHIPSPKYWPPKPLGDWFIPQEGANTASSDSYKNLWEGFLKEFSAIKSVNNHLNEPILLHLLEKYTSLIPSIAPQESGKNTGTLQRHPDVSLFDHSKLTAATAVCLYQYIKCCYPFRWDHELLKEEITGDHETEQPFLLIGGDLSGVQRFIYTITSKGALKSLKGRSFFLELLTEHVVDRLISEITLFRCNILFTGGGHFYILGPNTKEALEAIDNVRREINHYLLTSFNGSLLQFIEYLPFSKTRFRDASVVWADLSGKLDEMKRRKWEDFLDILLASPEMPHSDCLTEGCRVCGREDDSLSSGEPRMCTTCKEQFEFGERLQRVCREQNPLKGEYIAIAVWKEKRPNATGTIGIGANETKEYYEPLLVDPDSSQFEVNALKLYRVNDWEIHHFVGKRDRPFLAGIFHFRDFEDLEGIAACGFGLNRVAVLRMDVDHLGEIFSSGLPKKERTFSRVASLSRQLSIFFKYHLNGILDINRKNGYESLPRSDTAKRRNFSSPNDRLLSVVYSGGDDLFLIGHWLDILEASFDINDAFCLFTGNPQITFSGGYSLGNLHYPVYRFAADSGEAERNAKGNGRNSICFFDHTFKWKDANEIRAILNNEIVPLLGRGDSCLGIPQGSFSRGFFYRLLALVRAFREDNAWILPKVAYLAGRNGPQINWLKEHHEAAKAWVQLKDRFFMLPNEDNLKKLECATLWTLMMIRKGGEE